MKRKTLIMITVAIIICAATTLSIGLNLVYAEAFKGRPKEVFDASNAKVLIDKNTDACLTENSNSFEEVDDNQNNYPDFEYTIVNAKDILYCSCDQSNPHLPHYNLLKGVTVDVYSHKTGEFVGQISFASEGIYSYIKALKNEEFEVMTMAFDPEKNDKVVNLPEGDYRIEVYGGDSAFSYTYGNNSIFELTQSTITFYGGEKLIGYIDYLISDYIAKIESGIAEAPDPETAVSVLEYGSYEGYWYGWSYLPGYYSEGVGRLTERFPYIGR